MGCCGFCYDISDQVFIVPNPPKYSDVDPAQVVYITTPKYRNQIPAYYIPAHEKWRGKRRREKDGEEEEEEIEGEEDEETEGEEIKTTIIYSHGTREDLGSTFKFIGRFHRNIPVNVLSYEYAGFGITAPHCSPSEDKTYDSINGAVQYLIQEKNIELKDIIIFGCSMGCGASVHLASKGIRRRRDFLGLVLLCPYTSMVRSRVEKEWIAKMVELTGIDMFVNQSKIGKVRCPIMLIHGHKDSIFKSWHSRALWDRIKERYRYKCIFVDDGSHGNVISKLGNDNFNKEMFEFVEYCFDRIRSKKQIVKKK